MWIGIIYSIFDLMEMNMWVNFLRNISHKTFAQKTIGCVIWEWFFIHVISWGNIINLSNVLNDKKIFFISIIISSELSIFWKNNNYIYNSWKWIKLFQFILPSILSWCICIKIFKDKYWTLEESTCLGWHEQYLVYLIY